MRYETQALEVPNTVSVGAAIVVKDIVDKTIQFTDAAGTWNGTLNIEGSLDGTLYGDLITGITGPQIMNIKAGVVKIRVRCTAHTLGTIVGIFGGFNSRTDGG